MLSRETLQTAAETVQNAINAKSSEMGAHMISRMTRCLDELEAALIADEKGV